MITFLDLVLAFLILIVLYLIFEKHLVKLGQLIRFYRQGFTIEYHNEPRTGWSGYFVKWRGKRVLDLDETAWGFVAEGGNHLFIIEDEAHFGQALPRPYIARSGQNLMRSDPYAFDQLNPNNHSPSCMCPYCLGDIKKPNFKDS